MKLKILIIAIAALGFTFSVEAQTATPKVSKRQIQQNKRIHKGVKDGSITRRERAELKAQQRHIQRSKRRFKQDGKVTRKERARLHKKQRRAHRNIVRQKHDAQYR